MTRHWIGRETAVDGCVNRAEEDAINGGSGRASRISLRDRRGSRSSYSSSMCKVLMGQSSGWLEQLVLRVIKLSMEPEKPARQKRALGPSFKSVIKHKADDTV